MEFTFAITQADQDKLADFLQMIVGAIQNGTMSGSITVHGFFSQRPSVLDLQVLDEDGKLFDWVRSRTKRDALLAQGARAKRDAL